MLSRLFGRAIRLPLRLVPQQAVLRILTGPLRGMRWIAGAATHGCWLGTYERDVQRIFTEHIRSGDVVYDVGANAGFFTLLASKLAGANGTVYAFEPLPRNLEILEEHLRLNATANVHVFPLAVSDRSGQARFATGRNPAMGGLSGGGGIEVTTASLDEIRQDLRPPSFIKMDIEGGESAALAGAAALLRESGPTILLSAHGYEQHQVCTRFLRGEGYAIDLLVDGAADGNYVLLAKKI
jgi:FkbM family methyltransferase